MGEIIAWVLNHLNYWVIFLGMTIESSFIPFPSEAVIPPAAWMANNGTLNIFGVVVIANSGLTLVHSSIIIWLISWDDLSSIDWRTQDGLNCCSLTVLLWRSLKIFSAVMASPLPWWDVLCQVCDNSLAFLRD